MCKVGKALPLINVEEMMKIENLRNNCFRQEMAG